MTKIRKKSAVKSDTRTPSGTDLQTDPQIYESRSGLKTPESTDQSNCSDQIKHTKQKRSEITARAQRSEHSKHSGHSECSGRTKSRSGKHINHTESSEQAVSNGRPCVYILECKDGTLYTGWTNDFEKRFAAHSSGKGAKYTRGRGPLLPVYLEYLPDKIAATRREAAIKKLTRERKLALLKEATNSLNHKHK